MVLGFQLSAVGSLAGADLKKLKLNMVGIGGMYVYVYE